MDREDHLQGRAVLIRQRPRVVPEKVKYNRNIKEKVMAKVSPRSFDFGATDVAEVSPRIGECTPTVGTAAGSGCTWG